jgi:hypothetical protein
MHKTFLGMHASSLVLQFATIPQRIQLDQKRCTRRGPCRIPSSCSSGGCRMEHANEFIFVVRCMDAIFSKTYIRFELSCVVFGLMVMSNALVLMHFAQL